MVRTLPCHGRGREFESRRSRQHIKGRFMRPFFCDSVTELIQTSDGRGRASIEKQAQNVVFCEDGEVFSINL